MNTSAQPPVHAQAPLEPKHQAPPRPPKPKRLLSLKELGEKLGGISARTVHKKINEPGFPLAVELAPRLHRWVEQEVDEWIEAAPRRSPDKPEPPQLLRGRIERMKRTGQPA